MNGVLFTRKHVSGVVDLINGAQVNVVMIAIPDEGIIFCVRDKEVLIECPPKSHIDALIKGSSGTPRIIEIPDEFFKVIDDFVKQRARFIGKTRNFWNSHVTWGLQLKGS